MTSVATAQPAPRIPQRTAVPDNPRDAYEIAEAQKRAETPLTIQSISLVVNSADKNHFDKAIALLLKVAGSSGVRAEEVIHIGDYRNVSSDQMEKVGAIGGNVRAATIPPEDLRVSLSPTWILRLPKRRIILEGTNELERFVTKEGTFKDPDVQEEQPIDGGER